MGQTSGYCLLQNVCWPQKAAFRIYREVNDWTAIKRGLREGNVLSSHLFSLRNEIIQREIMDLEGFRVGRQNINCIRYTDDIALICDSYKTLYEISDNVVTDS